ncbi:MAG: DUF2975 domain-containing protein [Denitrovibrio sp.]|nr:MAG: DUF2975 domain-containing protein [Denitrovibrio sp.]
MNNIAKIKRVSGYINRILFLLMVIFVIYDICFWLFIDVMPEYLITVNSVPVPLVSGQLSPSLKLVGFAISLLPISALLYCLFNLHKIFSKYKAGIIFSVEHVVYFRRVAKYLLAVVFGSIIYESAKSVLFSLSNPPGSRVLEVSFNSNDIFILLIGSVIWVVAWVIEEGIAMAEENSLTI